MKLREKSGPDWFLSGADLAYPGRVFSGSGANFMPAGADF